MENCIQRTVIASGAFKSLAGARKIFWGRIIKLTSNGLSCKDFVEIVTEYLERTLSEAERVCFEAHLAECDGCRTYLNVNQCKLT